MNKISLYIYNIISEQSNVPDGAKSFDNFPSLIRALQHCTTEFFLVVDGNVIEQINLPYIFAREMSEDMVHAGLLFSTNELLQPMQITAFSWFFLPQPETIKSISWRASPRVWIMKTESWKKLSGVYEDYCNDTVRLMDFAYRLLRSGGEVVFDPNLMLTTTHEKMKLSTVQPLDEFIFVFRNLHRKAALTLLLYKLLHSVNWVPIYTAFRKALRSTLRNEFLQGRQWSILKFEKQKSIPRYSAIIPTLDRYDYLPAAIDSLLRQSFPPDEIIVNDQTPLERRDEKIYSPFDRQKVKVLFSDEKGQSSGRNNALSHINNDWCLLFDDDSLAMPDMAAKHIELLEHSYYCVSTGASLAPGQQFSDLPYNINFLHLADVLDTGNCFTHKSLLAKVDFFDLAFNRGPGADNDLGTKIHLAGEGIVYNPKAVRIHYKAATGGLRSYGVWWRFKTKLSGPYPPPTQTYTIRKYYDKKFWPYLYLRFYFKASYRNSVGATLLLWLLLPFKLYSSIQAAIKLQYDKKG